MQTQYSALGSWFEYLNDDCGYLQWSQYLINRLKSLNVGLKGVDIGCGNGYFTRALYKSGYDVCGVDISPSMLSVAKQKAVKEGANCEFLLGDITKLKLNGKVDFAVAVNDCLNYVCKDKLVAAFKHVYSLLNRGGAFIFDISSENKIRNILGNNMFGEDREDISYLWFNRQTDDGVEMELTFFVKDKDGRYTRYDERHVQFAHSENDIVAALQSVGFTNIVTEGHLGKDKSERINFIAQKV
jgi:ubiquinone/menaquinone biosynthesis C-methylase UbiE